MKDVYPNREHDSSDPLKYNDDKNILDSFQYIEGRRYHNLTDATYYFPNDEKEAVRLNLQHDIFTYVWKNHFSSPMHELLKSGNVKVLDIGCGTGRWLLDMANIYPKSTFVGVDLSPMFPNAESTPPNVFFLQLNLNNGLPFPNETFDFVNQRSLCNCVVLEQWKFYVKEMIRVTKSGGWLEFLEFSLQYLNGSPYFIKVSNLIYSEFHAKGINPKPETCVPQFLENFKELQKIRQEERSIPVNDQQEKLGDMVSKYISMNAHTVKLLVNSGWDVKDETYEMIIDKGKHEFEEATVYYNLYRWYTKKI